MTPPDRPVAALKKSAGRATLPFREAGSRPSFYGTAFWYNHLVEETPEHAVYVQYLVTAAALTTVDYAAFIIRPELADPSPTAANMLMELRDVWTTLPGLGVAVRPASPVHAHADRKGWKWTTDEITDGLAARDRDVDTIGRTPVDAYILGHQPDGEQVLVVGEVALERQGRLRWMSKVQAGCAGAPVFTAIPLDTGQHRLVCLGVVLPGADHNEIAPFTRIREAVATLLEPPSRRWWQRKP